MAGPSWLAATLAAVMIATAIYCAGRLAAARLWRRSTEVDTDTMHAVMGVAMAGMLLPQLRPLPVTAWEAVFGAAAAWFAYHALRSRHDPNAAASRWRCSHPVPHLIESAAMIYMLAGLPGSWPGREMAMPGMASGHPAAGGSLTAVAVILALFMIGYVLWTADQLTSLRRTPATVTSAVVPNQAAAPPPAPVGATGTQEAAGAISAVAPAHAHRAAGPALAPRLAAGYKIAMGISMGYMLILMF